MAKAKKETKEQPVEQVLWASADKLRKNMDAAEYKHIVLGLIFLKYISDNFYELYKKLEAGEGDYAGSDPDDPYEYRAENVFYVPPQARWNYLQGRAKLATIGKDVDDAMDAIEKDNPSLKGVLPKEYAKEKLDKQSLGGLIDLISTIALGDSVSRSNDVLGRVYEYFLGQFALAEGKKGGQFYTPRSVVQLLVEMLEPYEGRVFDPCCGSGGMFVQSEKFIEAHADRYNGKAREIDKLFESVVSVFGQESNQTTWRLCKMNLALRGIDSSNVKWNNEGSFLNDAHPDLKADFVIANPPFNDSDWSGELLKKDGRWQYGIPPSRNANYAWIQHFIYHLSPNGSAGFVMANSSLSAINTGETDLRKAIVDADLIECVVLLPKQLFYNTPIPACLLFMTKNKKENFQHRNRDNELLFIDARGYGELLSANQRTLTDDDINVISSIFKRWKFKTGEYSDIVGICKSVGLETVKSNSYNLSPNKYIDFNKIDAPNTDFTALVTSIKSITDEKHSLRFEAEKKIQDAFTNLGLDDLAGIYYSVASNDALLAISREIFKKWFVDFDLPSRLAKFKTDKTKLIKDFGYIPANFNVEALPYVVDIIDCLHTKKPENTYNPTDNILLQVYNIGRDGLISLSKPYYVNEADYELWTKNIEVTTGDCVITNVGRIGAIAQIPEGYKFGIGRNMTAIRLLNKDITPTYLIDYLLSPYMNVQCYRHTDMGTILDSLNVKGIKLVKILIPPKELVLSYEELMRPVRFLIELNNDVSLFGVDDEYAESIFDEQEDIS